MKIKFLKFILIYFLPFPTKAQNLILNSSFEDINYCETKIPCSPVGWYSVSNMPYGYANNLSIPAEGKCSMTFLIAFEKEVRTYWQTPLLCDLHAGKDYYISFNLYAPKVKFEPNYFGAFLSDRFLRSKNDTIIQLNSQTIVPVQSITLLKNGWYKITLFYKATGYEKYLLLGNFNMKPNNTILNASAANRKAIEYHVDNISLTPIDKELGKCTEYKKRFDSLYADTYRHRDFQNTSTTKIEITQSQNFLYSLSPDTLLLSGINFKFDSDKLNSTIILTEYFDKIDFSMIDKIVINGYADSIGKYEYNLRLSERRALSVKEYLLKNYQLKDSLIKAVGKGVTKDNVQLEKNRRVEVIVYKKKKVIVN
jgi:outer membrane protein OmpA-like peptidoglycan-associated protein